MLFLDVTRRMARITYTDVAIDATYQYMANPKLIFEAKTAYIDEDQELSATRAGGIRSVYG